MSKLADRIRKATRDEPARLGFATSAARTPPPTMLCLARVPPDKAGDAIDKGADAAIIESADVVKLKSQANKATETILGAQLEKPSREEVAALREAGADFVVLDIKSAMAEALLEEKIGVVLSLSEEADDTTLRLLGDVGLDAIIVPAPASSLTIEQLLGVRRIAALTRTPLLTGAGVDTDAGRLQLLRDSGVAGIIVDASALGKLQHLRQTIAALPPRSRKRRDDRSDGATIPAAAPVGASADDYDDDED